MPSEHLVGSSPIGSYPGSDNSNPGQSMDSPPLPASKRGLSTPHPFGVSPPCWNYLFPIPGKRQDSI